MTTDRDTLLQPATRPSGSGDGSPVPAAVDATAAPLLRVSSTQLFGAALEVQIDHHGTVYRLRQTALGKLILTK